MEIDDVINQIITQKEKIIESLTKEIAEENKFIECLKSRDKTHSEFAILRSMYYWQLYETTRKIGLESQRWRELRDMKRNKYKEKLQLFDQAFDYVHEGPYESFC
jgi:ElaB/YqjD/DUF883 family membrane-anchored ribosome-binding protein